MQKPLTIAFLSVALVSLWGCGGNHDANPTTLITDPQPNCDTTSTSNTAGVTDPRLVAAGSDERFVQAANGYAAQLGQAACSSFLGTPPPNTRGDTAAAPSAPGATSSGGGASGAAPAASESSRSDTNVQELGIDEADIMETDGRYLYVVSRINSATSTPPIAIKATATVDGATGVAVGGSAGDTGAADSSVDNAPPSANSSVLSIRIRELDNVTPSAKPLGDIALPADIYTVHGLYLRVAPNSQLLAIVTGPSQDPGRGWRTQILAYDVSDPASPQPMWKLAIDDQYLDSRVKDNMLYLVTGQYFAGFELMPRAYDSRAVSAPAKATNLTANQILPPTWYNGEPKPFLNAASCLVPATVTPDIYAYPTLVSVLAVDLSDPSKTTGVCTLESGGQIYMSSDALYLTRNESNETLVHKIRLASDGLQYAASGIVPGSLGGTIAQFAMSEHANDLRVVTTTYAFDIGIPTPVGTADASPPVVAAPTVSIAPRGVSGPQHRLFVLREDRGAALLKQIASLPNETHPQNLGKPGELLHGVRFVGERAYLVTFKKTDPLYVINLSKPEDPFVEGELQLPGYSDYLHPLGAKLLLGIGKDAIDQGDFAYYQGVKVGVFDVSNPAAPLVLGEKLIGKRGSDTPVTHNHLALSIISDASTGTHRFAVPVSVSDGSGKTNDPSTYYPWAYDGLFFFETHEARGDAPATFIDKGVLVGAQTDKSTPQYFWRSLDAMRSVLVDDAAHFVTDEGVWSALWSDPASATGPH